MEPYKIEELEALKKEIAYRSAQEDLKKLQSLTSIEEYLRFIATELIMIKQKLS